MSSKTLILGLGNRIMTDDGAGLDALAAFEVTHGKPEGVDLLDGGTLGLDLLVHMEGYERVLVLDCVTTGRQPGAVVRVLGDDVPAVFADCLSPHQMGLQDLAGVLQLQGRMPEMVVIGVEPESIEVGAEVTETVQRSIPKMVDATAAELRGWGLVLED